MGNGDILSLPFNEIAELRQKYSRGRPNLEEEILVQKLQS